MLVSYDKTALKNIWVAKLSVASSPFISMAVTNLVNINIFHEGDICHPKF